MNTELLTSVNLERAAYLLRNGEIVAFPTETVYGLGASVFNEAAVGKVFAAKGRPSDNPLIAHIADIEDMEMLVSHIPDEARLLMQAFFPGPLTLVLHAQSHIPAVVRAGLPTIAVRMPCLPLARELIRRVGVPLVGPSANRSGKPSATTARHVLDDLEGKIAAVLDGGPCQFGIESTVLSFHDGPVILRPGTITPQQIEQVLGRPVRTATHWDAKTAPPSPGLKYRHYAPEAVIKLFTSEEAFQVACNTPSSNKRLVCSAITAHELYSILRESDKQSASEILIYLDAATQSDHALMNRLTRAANLVNHKDEA